MSDMFTWASKGSIQSDEGFTVALGRPYIYYEEGHRKAKVTSEMLVKPFGEELFSSRLRVWESDGTTISDEDRARIIANIGRAFAFAGYVFQVS